MGADGERGRAGQPDRAGQLPVQRTAARAASFLQDRAGQDPKQGLPIYRRRVRSPQRMGEQAALLERYLQFIR